MEALNAAGLNPVSIISDRRKKPGKVLLYPLVSTPKFPDSSNFDASPPSSSKGLSRNINGGLIVFSSVLGGGFANALTFEEALQKFTGISINGTSDFDVGGLVDSLINFGTENPGIVIGGASVLAFPLVLSLALNKIKPWGVESAKIAYEKLANDVNSQLLDIRAPVDFREVGSPDIRSLKKKPVSIVFKGEDKTGFLKKLSLKFKEPENTTVFILDKFNGNSELVAELLTGNGFKAAYAIKDGAEGTRGWMNSGLPWIPPKKTLSLDFSNLTDVISEALGDGTDALPVSLGIVAATGLGLLAFTEIETVLQVLGSAALVQFVSKKLLFAEDRKETLQQVDEFLTTKVAPKELVDEIKQIGASLLLSTQDKEALPSPVVPETPVQKIDSITELNTESQVEASAESTPSNNSIPKEEVKAESVPGLPRPLSPYPYYPDFKPPASPSPSKP